MTFRRAGLGLFPWYLYLAFLWSCAALFTLAFAVAMFLRDPWNAERILTMIMIAALAASTIRIACGKHSWIRTLRTHYLILDADSLRVSLPDTGEVNLPWAEIETVTTEKRWLTFQTIWAFGSRTNVYTIVAYTARFSFTNMEIPRASRAGREVAARLRH